MEDVVLSPGKEVQVFLKSNLFSSEDKDAIAERLRTETNLQADSNVVFYPARAGFFPLEFLTPDVAIYILHTLFPLANIYADVLASAIWDQVKASFARDEDWDEDEPGYTSFHLVEVDDDGNTRRELRGETRDPEAIKELIRQFGRDQ